MQTTAVLLSALGIGLTFMGTLQLVPRVFNAMQLTSFVALSGLLNLAFKILFNILLVPALGYVGFALATTAMYITSGFIMLGLLRRRLGHLGLRKMFHGLAATALGATVLAIVAYEVARLLDTSDPLIRLLFAGGASSAAYIGTVWALRGRMSGFWELPGLG